MSKLRAWMLKQVNIGPYPGGLFVAYTSSSAYAGIVSLLMLVATTYNTTLRFWLPGLPFWWFLGAMLLMLFVIVPPKVQKV